MHGKDLQAQLSEFHILCSTGREKERLTGLEQQDIIHNYRIKIRFLGELSF